jgi:putative transposase
MQQIAAASQASPLLHPTLAEIAHRLGRKALEELAAVAKPDTLLAWYRKLIANKFDKHGCLFDAGVFTNF